MFTVIEITEKGAALMADFVAAVRCISYQKA
jgi:hypothetical protein